MPVWAGEHICVIVAFPKHRMRCGAASLSGRAQRRGCAMRSLDAQDDAGVSGSAELTSPHSVAKFRSAYRAQNKYVANVAPSSATSVARTMSARLSLGHGPDADAAPARHARKVDLDPPHPRRAPHSVIGLTAAAAVHIIVLRSCDWEDGIRRGACSCLHLRRWVSVL